MPRLTALPAGSLVRRLRRWPVDSQLGSRRNAMTASTALAARRAERDDVEAFLRATATATRPVPARMTAAHG